MLKRMIMIVMLAFAAGSTLAACDTPEVEDVEVDD